ncbi:hypothetical protein SDRG_07285 [Saprolegnia diclina VS20]|uniref:Carbonic anhydrase n=1 Tax=Saprolegnia diclina (strain VS20) TaxID=1156394 RepID=T0QMK9_SAPDV|nr:hypothetical protein SDRG_07285 [Saprolegnia diclina VS20]EQC35045.1 hypothetical protein SDRG_07285 [Saprolegnia diclina VS20]|eukprot:XP_008611329.1 hypothetical protein SDRG_07285 [Saprolegnia diclina VS20]
MGCNLSKKKQSPRTIRVSPKKQATPVAPPVIVDPPPPKHGNSCNMPFGADQGPIAIGRLQAEPNGKKAVVAFGAADARGSHDECNIFFTWDGGATAALTLRGVKYKPVQFHFHTPSEHTIEGAQFPLELHVVHVAPNDRWAVVSYVYQYGETEDAFLKQVWPSLPQLSTIQAATAVGRIDGSVLVQPKAGYYQYTGASGDGVEWVVAQRPRIATPGQVASLFGALRASNARPTQPVTGRTVTLLC